MKVGIIGHVDHGKTTLTQAIKSVRLANNEIIIVGEDNTKIDTQDFNVFTENKYYRLESLKLPNISELLPDNKSIDLGDCKSGRESRRERRKQERKNK